MIFGSIDQWVKNILCVLFVTSFTDEFNAHSVWHQQ